LSTVVGHTDAIWDIAVIPSKADPEGYLVSASADGTVKVWDTTGADGNVSLFASWRYDTNEGGDNKSAEDAPVPIAIAVYPSDLKNVMIGYTNGVIKLFEVGTGQAVLDFLPTDEVEGE
jgi:striatin 1/3/4